jgi:hypothetical protein
MNIHTFFTSKAAGPGPGRYNSRRAGATVWAASGGQITDRKKYFIQNGQRWPI